MLVRNAMANALGGIIPGLAALASLPFIVHHLGTAGYGLLALIASIVGYFAIIDIAVTTGAVKFVAEFRARGEARAESEVIVLGLILALGVGVTGCAGLLLFAEPIMTGMFRLAGEELQSGIAALQIAAFGFFLAQLQQYLHSLPQALQRYPLSAAVESVFGVVVPVASVAVLVLGQGLEEVVLVRVVCSAANIAVLAWLCRPLFPSFEWRLPERALLGQVLSFNAFAYLSRVAALTYAHADKLIIGALLGMGAVAYFSIAATLASRVLSITFRISSIMYPAASALAATAQWERLKDAYFNTARYVFCINAAAVLIMILFAREIMHHWMGPQFAAYGELVMALTALAMLVDSLSNLPSMINDGLGHTRVTGLWAFARAAVGLVLLLAFVEPFGIDGAAVAHLIASVLITALFLVHVHGRTVPFRLSELLSRAYLRSAFLLVATAAAGLLLRPSQTLGLLDAMVLASLLMLLYVAASVLFVVRRDHLQTALQRVRGA
jgi:O-antigen/teichoic acid export membrane protein